MGEALRCARWMVLTSALVSAVVGQYLTTPRHIDITLSEGTSMAAAVSPDRRWIAFDLVGRLWLMPFGGGEAKALTPLLLEARQPTWSPDSDTIAFQGYDDGAWHIYVVPREGGDPRALTTGEFDDREPAWSHRGASIAFSSDRSGGITTIWTVDAGSRQVRQLSKRDGAFPVWSPDDLEITMASADRINGSGAAVSERERQPGLWGSSVNRGERLIVKATPDLLPGAAGWSTDGTQLAFTTADARLAVNGQAVSAGQDVFPFRPQWISRSEFVYTADGHIRRWSPVGVSEIPFAATVSLSRPGYQIEARSLETSPGRKPVRGIVTPTVSPDGRRVAFIALGDLWVMPIGQAPARVTDDPAVELDPSWSPDGRRLAFSSDRTGRMELWIHDFGANSDTKVSEERGAVSGAAWSPDGSHIAYVIDRRGVATVRVQPGDGLGGTLPVGQEIGRPSWSADSRSVAVGSLFPYSTRFREGLNQLLIRSFDLSSTTARVLLPGHSAGNRQDNGPVWSPNGAEIAFVSEGTLWSVGVDGSGTPTAPAFAVAEDQPESPSWEGDSRHLVYQTPAGLKRVLADGSAPESIPLSLDWRAPAPPPRVIVHAGRVFDGLSDGLRSDIDIVVERGRISDMYPHRDPHNGGFVVDASREVVMPGLVEMHAHLDPDYGERFGRVWLAYGVTSVRIPSINPFAALELREAIDSGRRVGPRVFVAGDPFDGARIYYPGGVSITSDATLDRELDRARDLDVDFFKTYVRLPDRLQQRIVDYAHALGKPVTSHELFPAVAFGVDGVEHLRGTSRRGYSPKASETNRAYQDVVEVLARSGMTLTPTIGIQGGFPARVTGDKTVLFDRRLALFPLGVVGRLTDLASAPPSLALDARIKGYEQTIKAIVAGGGRIIAGTDAPIDPYGLGLHVELEEYVHAGLTPFQALQTATLNAARALGLETELGTIEPGKVADLAFVIGDPLEDIHRTRDVTRVMKGGRVYTLDDLLRR